jgi:hypothetical protein
MTRKKRIFTDQKQGSNDMKKIIFATSMTAILCTAHAGQDTVSVKGTLRAPDSAAIGSVIDTTTRPDSLLPPLDTTRTTALPAATKRTPVTTSAVPPVKTDSAAASDSFSVFSSTIGAIGGGLSLGSLPVLKNWKNGLPFAITDFSLPAVTDTAGDTVRLQFKVKQSPDIYNMMFPLTLSISRLSEHHRMGLAFSFAMLSKKFNAAIEVDSSRTVTLEQTMRYYTVFTEFNYGTRIPEDYFSVDMVDRTDAIVGIALSPFIGLRKSSTVSLSRSNDAALKAIKDSVIANQNTFNAAGVAIAWRLGLVTLRRVSKTGGMETTLSYQGQWCTRFKTSHNTFTYGSIDPDDRNPKAAVSYFSNRFDITISLIRRLF